MIYKRQHDARIADSNELNPDFIDHDTPVCGRAGKGD